MRKPVSPMGGATVSMAFHPRTGPIRRPLSERAVGTARYRPADGMARRVPNRKYETTATPAVRSVSQRRIAVTMPIAAPSAPDPSDATQSQPLPYVGSQATVTSASIASAARVSIAIQSALERPETPRMVDVARCLWRAATGTGLPFRSLVRRSATWKRRSSIQSRTFMPQPSAPRGEGRRATGAGSRSRSTRSRP